MIKKEVIQMVMKDYEKPKTLPANINIIVDTQLRVTGFDLLLVEDDDPYTPQLGWQRLTEQRQYMYYDYLHKPCRIPLKYHNIVQYILHHQCYLFSLCQPNRFMISGMEQLLEKMNADGVNITFHNTQLERIPSSRQEDIYMQIQASRSLQVQMKIENKIREEIRPIL